MSEQAPIGWMTLVSDETREQRYSTCKACEHINEKRICTLCDCLMPVKTLWAEAECPVGKWSKVE